MPLFGVPEWGESPWGESPDDSTPPDITPPIAGCDVANSVADLWFRLGFLSPEDMNIDDRWVTIAEMYQFGDDAAKLLGRVSSLYLTYDASIAVTAGTAAYALPDAHVFTEGAWLLYDYQHLPPQFLRPSTVGQLFGLDSVWSAAAGFPLRISFDAGGVGAAALYPVPIADAVLAQVAQFLPADVVAGASRLPLSPILQDMFTYWILGAARGKESDSSMPEIATHCKERVALYLDVIGKLWGGGE